tara:strand:- start:417 stop:1073 length:657 start_codon:yes stop_codon:yes gene_type:complete
MNPEFWRERWEKNDIGFHQEDINAPLQKYWQYLKLSEGESVFVPLCGKSRDLLWIQSRGHPVLGVEISPLGVETFFKENNLQTTSVSDGKFIRWKYGTLEILCGDFFDLQLSHLEKVAVVYDRASLVALPTEIREQYVKHFVSLLSRDIRVLLLTLEYQQKEMEGPPFSVSEEEVNNLYGNNFKIEKLHGQEILKDLPRFKERGLTSLTEKVFLLSSH